MSRTGLDILSDGIPDLLRRLAEVAKHDVLVGVPAGAEREDGVTNAEIGYLNEFGSPASNIPARPHLIPGVQSVEARTTAQLAKAAKAAAEGRLSQADSALHKAGLIAQAAVRSQITSGNLAPLAARTIEYRLARGRTGTRPLIDTGQYRNSITYVVRNGKS